MRNEMIFFSWVLLLNCWVNCYGSDIVSAKKGKREKVESFAAVVDSLENDVLRLRMPKLENAALTWHVSPETSTEMIKQHERQANWQTVEFNVKEYLITMTLNSHGTQSPLDVKITNSYDDDAQSKDLNSAENSNTTTDKAPKNAPDREMDLTSCRGRGHDELHLNGSSAFGRRTLSGKVLRISDGRVEFQENAGRPKIFLADQVSAVVIGACGP